MVDDARLASKYSIQPPPPPNVVAVRPTLISEAEALILGQDSEVLAEPHGMHLPSSIAARSRTAGEKAQELQALRASSVNAHAIVAARQQPAIPPLPPTFGTEPAPDPIMPAGTKRKRKGDDKSKKKADAKPAAKTVKQPAVKPPSKAKQPKS